MAKSAGAIRLDVKIKTPEAFFFLLEAARHKAAFGGRGSAKSHSFAETLAATAHSMPKRIVCARQFQNSIRDSVKELIEQKIYALGLNDNFKITDAEIIAHKTGSRFSFVGLDRNPQSIKSLEGADIAWVDEAQSVKDKSVDMLIPTVRKPGSELWWSWNPDDAEDPVDKLFRGGSPPERSIVRAVSFQDNPWFWDTELPDEMQSLMRRDLQKFRHVWLGHYARSTETAVFRNWRIGRVQIGETDRPRFGLDFGFGKDPSAFVKVYILPKQRTIYIAAEAYGHGVGTEDLPDLIDTVTEARRFPIMADSARPDTIQFLQRRGYAIRGAIKGPGSVKDGIEWLQGFSIVIDPDCKHMVAEAKNYSWQTDKRTGERLPVLEDANNHLWDAVRYATEDDRRASAPGVFFPKWK